ncbi:MAG: DUF2851 family protein [Chitinophagaceae bacterium]|nr:DUF2851 family protein [Chitinophagaceae bacterium]
MTERLLQYIWQFQYFSKPGLATTTGEMINILHPGQYNTNQGPDFLNARIQIGNKTWAGHVELHLASSGWIKHKHDKDKNYRNVILHVVWENDMPEDKMPVLELEGRVPYVLLNRYKEMMRSAGHIPCGKNVSTANALTLKSWKDRLVAERLMQKAGTVRQYLEQNRYHWEETCWWLLARNFGMKVNAAAFEAIARTIPLTVLARNKSQLHHLEALLLGQAGLLNGTFTDEYALQLQKEYKYQQQKYQLTPCNEPVYFLRMRPGSFPTVRLAQLAMLISHSGQLFTNIKEAKSVKEIRNWLDVTASEYWHYHFRFDAASSFKKKILGATMISNIIINTVAPLLFAFGEYQQEEKYKEWAIRWLEETPAEINTITRRYMALGMENKNAFDSQAIIELSNQYCSGRRCLECAVGYELLRG